VLGAWCLVLGAWCLVLGAWCNDCLSYACHVLAVCLTGACCICWRLPYDKETMCRLMPVTGSRCGCDCQRVMHDVCLLHQLLEGPGLGQLQLGPANGSLASCHVCFCSSEVQHTVVPPAVTSMQSANQLEHNRTVPSRWLAMQDPLSPHKAISGTLITNTFSRSGKHALHTEEQSPRQTPSLAHTQIQHPGHP
jgi:hypothetical protein